MGADRAVNASQLAAAAASTSWDFANSIGFFANVGSMPFTQRQKHFPGIWRPFAAAIVVGLLLGWAGPFGTYPALPTATRYAFWLGLTVAGALATVAADVVLPVSRLRAGAFRMACLALVSALPMTFLVAWTISLVQPGRFYTPQQLPALYAAVVTVQLLVVYATKTAAPPVTPAADGAAAPSRAPALPEPVAAASPPAFPSALLSKLPAGLGSDIIALETEDHYLRVHAVGGSALILMRMADAVALLDPQLGAQVHRRWWVAQDAVAGVRTEGQKLSLSLIDNTLVPVGRTFAATARARFAHARNIVPPDPASIAGKESTVGGASLRL